MTTDTHAQARAYAQARLDDRLAPEHQAWLAAHLAGCAECRRYADELSSLERLLPETFQARWDSLRPARPDLSAPMPIGGPAMVRQKLFNYAGITLGLGALAVLLIGFAFALQTATTTDSLIPGQAVEPTGSAGTMRPTMFATHVEFGDAIVLEGYNLIPRGDGVVTVELLWHALAAPPADYMVGAFAMPDGAQSAIVAQSDSVPAMGTRPTRGWQAGEYILDAHNLTVSLDVDMEAGPFVLWVNVYDPQTGERLPSDPPGGGPFNATAIGTLHVPAEAPLTATLLPYATDWTPEPCVGECTPTPTPIATYTPCAEGYFGCPASEGPTYTVQDGDTLQSIASLYGITVEEIRTANGLTEPSIAVGQELYIPLRPLTTPHCAEPLTAPTLPPRGPLPSAGRPRPSASCRR